METVLSEDEYMNEWTEWSNLSETEKHQLRTLNNSKMALTKIEEASIHGDFFELFSLYIRSVGMDIDNFNIEEFNQEAQIFISKILQDLIIGTLQRDAEEMKINILSFNEKHTSEYGEHFFEKSMKKLGEEKLIKIETKKTA